MHEMAAAQPFAKTEPSEVNLIVIHPEGLFAVTTPGLFVPVYVPNKGAAVLVPLYM